MSDIKRFTRHGIPSSTGSMVFYTDHIAALEAVKATKVSREALTDLLASELGDTYSCTRVWSAWGWGTMTQDDFEPAEERAGEIADSIMRAMFDDHSILRALTPPTQDEVK